MNPRIQEYLWSGVSQRRIARLLKISRATVAKKFVFLAQQARIKNQKDFQNLDCIREFQFDDLETFEHTICKPLSITMAVKKDTRRILGFQVSSMPANGHLAKIARKRYGPRPDERKKGRDLLFESICAKIDDRAIIHSDKNPHYLPSVKKWFPEATHQTTKGRRGSVTGQGELKRVGFDPLFSLNHTFAMLRANINRLFRKTWCTTKLPERLADHIELYAYYHNRVLIQN